MGEGLGFRVQCFGFRVRGEGLGFRLLGSGRTLGGCALGGFWYSRVERPANTSKGSDATDTDATCAQGR